MFVWLGDDGTSVDAVLDNAVLATASQAHHMRVVLGNLCGMAAHRERVSDDGECNRPYLYFFRSWRISMRFQALGTSPIFSFRNGHLRIPSTACKNILT